LLFVWLILDLLKPGGRAAVIVPEGVLFGSTGAHRELRRQLLFEHKLEAVISLPAGVFQPYTGVKTSILIFKKLGGKLKRGKAPRTESVWFYEVAADGYTLDAKRNDKPEPNDLWDALRKWKSKEVDNAYYQPRIYDSRWRVYVPSCWSMASTMRWRNSKGSGFISRSTTGVVQILVEIRSVSRVGQSGQQTTF
jgi:type I restriction enzyme M protein